MLQVELIPVTVLSTQTTYVAILVFFLNHSAVSQTPSVIPCNPQAAPRRWKNHGGDLARGLLRGEPPRAVAASGGRITGETTMATTAVTETSIKTSATDHPHATATMTVTATAHETTGAETNGDTTTGGMRTAAGHRAEIAKAGEAGEMVSGHARIRSLLMPCHRRGRK